MRRATVAVRRTVRQCGVCHGLLSGGFSSARLTLRSCPRQRVEEYDVAFLSKRLGVVVWRRQGGGLDQLAPHEAMQAVAGDNRLAVSLVDGAGATVKPCHYAVVDWWRPATVPLRIDDLGE